MTRCDKTVCQKNVPLVTHFLAVMGQDVIKLHFRKMCNVTHKLLIIGQHASVRFTQMRLPFIKMCNVTH